MFAKQLTAGVILLVCAMPGTLRAQRISEDKDLIEIDLSKWNCTDPSGTAKTQDGVDRNRGKNRSGVDLSRLNIPSFDTAGFLRAVSLFDAQTKGKRRQDISSAQKIQLAAIEKQIVSFTGYLVIAYPGPPESTNCGSVDFHDWHLEVFEKPLDYPPGIGDPTPIICEITPHVQNAIYQSGIRLQSLAGFMRHPDLTSEATGHPARKVRFTGSLLWDDDHNGAADIGPRVNEKGKNGYHHPWRSTAFEIHPVLKIEALDAPPPVPGATVATSTNAPVIPAPAPTAPAPILPVPAPVSVAPAAPRVITIIEPVKIKIPYGETILPRGARVEVVSRSAQTVTVRYLGQDNVVPLSSTDLR